MDVSDIKMEIEESKENIDALIVKEVSYEEKLQLVNKIASPMAPKKLTKKIYKLVKKGENLYC